MTPTPASISLRPWTTADAQVLCDLLRDDRKRIAVEEPWRPDDFLTLEGQFRRIDEQLAEEAQGRMVCRLILHRGDVVGTTALMAVERLATFSAAIGYWVHPAARGHGVATAGALATVAIARDELHLHSLRALARTSNIGSSRVLERCGFHQVGLLREHELDSVGWHDMTVWQLLLRPT